MLLVVVGTEVVGELGNETVLVAKEDQRLRVVKLVLDEEVLDLSGIIAVWGLFDDLLDLGSSVALDGGLDELEVDIVVSSLW